MLSLNDTAAIQVAARAHPDPTLRSLLAMRGNQLAPTDGEPFQIIAFEAGDTLDRLEAELGFTPLQSADDACVFGDPDFMPSWEWIEAHPGWFELAYVFNDDGGGAIIFVSRAVGVDSGLLDLCSHWAG
jgi:hypothetical protein